MKVLLFCLLSWFSLPLWAVVEYHDFKQVEQEQAYQTLIHELRCLVCQNQTIADSNADLAKDLRRQVYEMLQQGQTEDNIIQFMQQRYGDFVLYKPQFNLKTSLLWLGPALFFLIGLVIVLYVIKQRNKQAGSSAVLPHPEQTELKDILEKGDEA